MKNNKNIVVEQLTTIHIYYYMPDYSSILQEFTWQTLDLQPKFPRIKRFLDHWQTNIEAAIESIYLAHCDPYGEKRYFQNITYDKNFLN